MGAIVQLMVRILLVDATGAEDSVEPFFVRFFAGRKNKVQLKLKLCRSEAINLYVCRFKRRKFKIVLLTYHRLVSIEIARLEKKQPSLQVS